MAGDYIAMAAWVMAREITVWTALLGVNIIKCKLHAFSM